MAEGVGFEPTEPCGSPVFKTGAIDHSTTLPMGEHRRRFSRNPQEGAGGAVVRSLGQFSCLHGDPNLHFRLPLPWPRRQRPAGTPTKFRTHPVPGSRYRSLDPLGPARSATFAVPGDPGHQGVGSPAPSDYAGLLVVAALLLARRISFSRRALVFFTLSLPLLCPIGMGHLARAGEEYQAYF
jgi:hypothetical protein